MNEDIKKVNDSEEEFVTPNFDLFDATDLWNDAIKFNNVYETNGYWRALKDLEKLGVIRLSSFLE